MSRLIWVFRYIHFNNGYLLFVLSKIGENLAFIQIILEFFIDALSEEQEELHKDFLSKESFSKQMDSFDDIRNRYSDQSVRFYLLVINN